MTYPSAKLSKSAASARLLSRRSFHPLPAFSSDVTHDLIQGVVGRIRLYVYGGFFEAFKLTLVLYPWLSTSLVFHEGDWT